ncbi:MAG: hypothetical protein HKN96_02940, partial [Flavobacteriaceae bacterium]|nr:hypothetical protein [Flavobacteriaceae bacterium]
MKLKLLFSCFILFFLCALSSFSQTTLSAGDIAITGFTTDNPDQFTFVLLVDVESGTQVNFTDRGWDSVAGAFRSGEGTLTWTATSNLSAGTNIYVQDLDNPFTADVGTITDDGSFQLSGSGDQILVYQGTDLSPTFLNAIHTDGDDGGWSNATGTSSTALPPGLTDGVDAIYFGEIDNGSFMCTGNPINGSPSYVLSEIVDVSNWELENSLLSTTPLGGGCTYSIMDPCTDISGTDSDGDGINDACDEDEDNDGIPDYLDGCSTIDIANTIAIGIPITDGSSYSLEETTITYNTTNPNTNYGYVAGNQGNAIRFQGSTINEELELGFSVPIQNVNFKLTDFDQGEQVTVNAYDDLNNLINLTSNNVPLKGSLVDRTGNFFENNDSAPESDGDDEADDIKGGVHFYFPGAISRIVFIYNTGGGQSIRFTELNYCLKDSDGDSILDFRDIDSDNDGIPDLVEAGGVDLDGDGYIENPADNNGNGIPDIYDFRCTNSPSANGWATSVHNSVNTSNANDALGNGTFSYADIGVGGSLELQFSDIIPAGNNVIIRHVRQSGSGQLPFMVERSSDGITYSNDESFLTSFNGSYEVLSYVLIGGNTSYVKITNLSSETLGIDYAKYSYGLNADCSGINGVLITNLDNDNDGIANSRDLDSDNDGIFDVIEANLPDTDNNGLADNFADLDSDGFNDNYDGDVGNDGVAENMTSAAIITGNDTDADGIPNTYPNVNQDSNGYPNPFDIDADDDGIPDNIEAQPTLGYIVPAGAFNFNGLDTAYLSGIYPEDTDVDGIPDYLDSDSDSDGTPDIQENGDVNAISNIDIDSDGLDDALDSNTSSFDVNDEISSGNSAEMTATFGDADGDLLTGGDLDYRDLFDINPLAVAALDFDGIDDYAEITNSPIDGYTDFTISAWIKYEGPAISSGQRVFVMGQKGVFEITLSDWSSDASFESISSKFFTGPIGGLSSGWAFKTDSWVNITVTASFDGSNTTFRIYKNGFAGGVGTIPGAVNSTTNPFRLGIVNGTTTHLNFEGWIDEVRFFDSYLTEDQVRRMIYQEIENIGGNVTGKTVPQAIKDDPTDTVLSWSLLNSYYDMSDIQANKVPDVSGNNKSLRLANMTTLQQQTAPMPFETIQDGDWATEATWEHGDVWDIEDLEAAAVVPSQSTEPWSIVHIHH